MEIQHYLNVNSGVLRVKPYTGNKKYLSIAKKSLDFLVAQTFINGIYVPIGQNGWYPMQGERAYFDQQPEEVSAMVQTLAVMYFITGEEK